MNTVALPSPLELTVDLTDEQFFHLCQQNSDFQFERTATGTLIIMPPTGGNTSRHNVKITTQLDLWNSETDLGEVFDSNGGFKLPNGAERAPDAAWLQRDRWDALAPEAQERFVSLCPDFVIELPSPSDSLEKTQAKMQEYLENGARLGWLLDRRNQRVEIYRPGRAVEVLVAPKTLPGEDVLPGFVLDLGPIFYRA